MDSNSISLVLLLSSQSYSPAKFNGLTLDVQSRWQHPGSSPGIFRKRKKENPWNYRLVSITLFIGKVMEQILLGVISKHRKGKRVIWSSQCRFMKDVSYLTKWIATMMKSLGVDKGRTVDDECPVQFWAPQ